MGRGFSIFAPVLGTVLLTIALAFAVSTAAQEAEMYRQIQNLQARTYTQAATQNLQWDALGSFGTALRRYFYDYSYYLPGYTLTDEEKNKIVWHALQFLGFNPDSSMLEHLWRDLGYMKYRWYVVGDEKNVEYLVDHTSIEKPTDDYFYIKISAPWDRSLPDAVTDINTFYGVETRRSELFADVNIGVTIPYPAKAVEGNVGQLISKAKEYGFYAGFLPHDVSEWPAAAFYNGGWGQIEEMGSWTHETQEKNALNPCKSVFGAMWVEKKDDAEYWKSNSAVTESLKAWLQSQGWEFVQYMEAPEVDVQEGLPYIRLVCFTGDLAGVLTGKSDDVICAKAEDEDLKEVKGDNTFYIRVKKVKVKASKKFSAKCAPGGEVNVAAIVDLDFDEDKTEIKSSKKFAKFNDLVKTFNLALKEKYSAEEQCDSEAYCDGCSCTCNDNCEVTDEGYDVLDEIYKQVSKDTKGFFKKLVQFDYFRDNFTSNLSVSQNCATTGSCQSKINGTTQCGSGSCTLTDNAEYTAVITRDEILDLIRYKIKNSCKDALNAKPGINDAETYCNKILEAYNEGKGGQNLLKDDMDDVDDAIISVTVFEVDGVGGNIEISAVKGWCGNAKDYKK